MNKNIKLFLFSGGYNSFTIVK